MKSVERLIQRIRRETRNENNSNTVASDSLSDEEFIDALNDAQERLQSLISGVYSVFFERQVTIPVVNGQSEYVIDDNVYLGNRIVEIKYTATNDERDFYELENRDIKEIDHREGLPCAYVRTAKTVILYPVPNRSNSKMKVTYEKTLPKLDKKRGVIASGTQSVGVINIVITTPDSFLEDIFIGEKVTIVNEDGEVTANKLKVTGYNSGTKTLSFEEQDYTFGTEIQVGYSVLLGGDSVNVSELPDICERYLIAYGMWQILNRDDLKLAGRAKERVGLIEDDIINSFAEESRDVKYIPIYNKEFY